MDIYERYSEEDIRTIREYVGMMLEQQGLDEVMQLLKRSQDTKRFLEIYDEDRKKDDQGEPVFSEDPIENSIISAITKALTRPKTEKLDEEEEYSLRLEAEETEKIWSIVLNDEEIQEEIAEAIDSLYYDEKDLESRMQTVKSVISVLRIIPNQRNDIIYEALNDKIKQMNFNDFALTYANSLTRAFFSTPQFKETILDKINGMSNSEFIYFLLSTQDGLDGKDPDIMEHKRTKTEKSNNITISEVFNSVDLSNKLPIETEPLDRVLSLYREASSNNKLEMYSNLTDTEFVRLFLLYKNVYAFFDKDLLNSEITTRKLSDLSRENMIVLVETFYKKYMEYLEDKENEELGELSTTKMNGQWESIIKEAQNRGLVSKDFEKIYGKEEIEKSEEIIKFYKEINRDSYLPVEFVSFKATIDEKDKDVDERDSKDILVQRFQDANDKLQELLVIYDTIDELAKQPDIKVLQDSNRYNIRYRKEQISGNTSRFQNYLINYYKRRILAMPPSYATFFQVIDGGLLNDAMQLKAEELQNKLIKGGKEGPNVPEI